MSLHKWLLSLVLIAVLLAAAFPLVITPTPAAAADSWIVMDSGTTEQLNSVWGSSCSNVFAVGYKGTILRYNGSTWSTMNSGTSMGLNGIWGSSATNVFAVGWSGTILHWDGNTWTAMNSGTQRDLNAVWGNAANSVFAVGGMQAITYWNGHTWTPMTTPELESNFTAVWGTAYNNVYVVGSDGDIYHFDGTSWTKMTSDTPNTLNAIWGSSASDIWAAGILDSSKVHYNGSAWSHSGMPNLNYYMGLWGTSDSNIYLAGYAMTNSGIIKLYNGNGWSSLSIPDCTCLNGIWGSSNFDIFAVGNSGTILHYGGCGLKTASVGTNLGAVNFTVDYGSISNLNRIRVADTSCSTPSGYDFPYGLFSFKISNLNPGQTVKVTITFPRHLPINVKYYKCIGGNMVDCTRIMTRLNDSTLVLSLTDGGLGDADGLAYGTIVDPGGPVEPVEAAQVYGQGTMSTTITQQAPVALPAISVKSASLSATKVAPGTPVTITADVANTGTSNGTASIKVYVNGQEESSQGVTVTSGSNTPLTFTVSRNEPGTYSVYVGGTSAGSFTVDWFADSTILIISGAAILFAFAIGAIFVTRRKQAH